jgi:hypothetical protein
MLPPGPASEHLTHAPSSTSGITCSSLDLCAGVYIRTAKLVQDILIVTSTLRIFIRASSSSSSASSPIRDSTDEYPEIGDSACQKSVEDNHLILMVAPNGDRSLNSSSGYSTIGRSETSSTQIPSAGLVRNLTPDFNVVQVQAIMEIIKRMTHDGSHLSLLAQQGAEAANLVVAKKSASELRREPHAGHNDRARHARSEATSSASPNQHLAENDACWRVTQNHSAHKYDRNWDDLCNVIEGRRRIRHRTSSPP